MTKDIEKLAVEIGELLAGSTLDKKTKDAILENLDTMPEDLVFKLLDALKNEKEQIDSVVFDMELFLKEQDERWAKLEEEQLKLASSIGDELFEKLKDHPVTSVDAPKDETPVQ
jgi:hypothetical protein